MKWRARQRVVVQKMWTIEYFEWFDFNFNFFETVFLVNCGFLLFLYELMLVMAFQSLTSIWSIYFYFNLFKVHILATTYVWYFFPFILYNRLLLRQSWRMRFLVYYFSHYLRSLGRSICHTRSSLYLLSDGHKDVSNGVRADRHVLRVVVISDLLATAVHHAGEVHQ